MQLEVPDKIASVELKKRIDGVCRNCYPYAHQGDAGVFAIEPVVEVWYRHKSLNGVFYWGAFCVECEEQLVKMGYIW